MANKLFRKIGKEFLRFRAMDTWKEHDKFYGTPSRDVSTRNEIVWISIDETMKAVEKIIKKSRLKDDEKDSLIKKIVFIKPANYMDN